MLISHSTIPRQRSCPFRCDVDRAKLYTEYVCTYISLHPFDKIPDYLLALTLTHSAFAQSAMNTDRPADRGKKQLIFKLDQFNAIDIFAILFIFHLIYISYCFHYNHSELRPRVSYCLGRVSAKVSLVVYPRRSPYLAEVFHEVSL